MRKIEKGMQEKHNKEGNMPGKMTRRKALRMLGSASVAAALPFRLAAGSSFPGSPVDEPVSTRKEVFFAYRSFWPEFEAMKEFRKAGVNTVCIFAANTDNSLGMPYSKYPPVWRWFGKYDFNSLNRQYDDVLAINPDADFICMIDLKDLNSMISQVYHATRNKLNRMGAPFEVFSFNDLPKADLGQYKFFIFPGIFEMTPEKEELLKKYVFSKERTVLFIYAPGISDGKKLDTSFVKALTGCDFKTPGVTKVKKEGWLSVYAPGYETVTPELLKELAAHAGVTIFCEDQIPVYANEKLVAVHVASGGEKIITLPVKVKKVTELYTGQVVKVRNRKFSYNFATPDTALFELE